MPSSYMHKAAHDLPTPPASRLSPPLLQISSHHREPSPALSRPSSPSAQAMSTYHRGLPPPAGMAIQSSDPPQALALSMSVNAPALRTPSRAPSPQPPPSGSLGTLPAPPSHWQGADETLRAWLAAKTEEEKRRQEEERTRQEGLRLERTKTDHDILRTMLQGGIPPPMVPIVFAGMAGAIVPQALTQSLTQSLTGWSQQLMTSSITSPHSIHHTALAINSGQPPPVHAEQRRDSPSQPPSIQPFAPYTSIGPNTPSLGPNTPGSSSQAVFSGYPASPAASRGRSTSVAAPVSSPVFAAPVSVLARTTTSAVQHHALVGRGIRSQHGPSSVFSSQSALPPSQPPSYPPHHPQHYPKQHLEHPQNQQHLQNPQYSQHPQHQQQEAQRSQALYFHHWQPPATPSTISSIQQQPTSSADPNSRKRKAAGPQEPIQGETRLKSFHFVTQQQSIPSSPATSTSGSGARRGHARQQSDLSSYRSIASDIATGSASNRVTGLSKPERRSGDPANVTRETPTGLVRSEKESPIRMGGGHSSSVTLSEYQQPSSGQPKARQQPKQPKQVEEVTPSERERKSIASSPRPYEEPSNPQ